MMAASPIQIARRAVPVVLVWAGVAGAQQATPVAAPPVAGPTPQDHATVTTDSGSPPAPTMDSLLAPWTVRIDPHVWWVSPSGSVKLPASSSAATTNGDSVRMEQLNLDTPRFSPYAEVQIDADPWRFSLSGGSFSLDRGHTTADTSFVLGDMPVSIGDSLAVSFQFTTVQMSGGYRFWRYDFKAHSQQPADAWDSVVSMYVVGGVRLDDVDFEVNQHTPAPGAIASAGSHQVFVEPYAGVRIEAELARHFGIDFELTGGGFVDSDRSSYSLDVALAFAWRPCDTIGVQIGWRQLAFSLKDGQSPQEFDFTGRMAGVFAGVTIRF